MYQKRIETIKKEISEREKFKDFESVRYFKKILKKLVFKQNIARVKTFFLN